MKLNPLWLRWLFPLASLDENKPKLPRYRRPGPDAPVYTICFQHYGDVKYKLDNIKGTTNLTNIWNHLIKTGYFTDSATVTKEFAFSLRAFRNTTKGGGLVKMNKKYCSKEPKSIKDEFERLREQFCNDEKD